MTWERMGDLLPLSANRRPVKRWTAGELRRSLPILDQLEVTDEAILRAEPTLLDLLAQDRICGACQGYEHCAKLGDARGMYDRPVVYQGELVIQTHHCRPYVEYLAMRKAARFQGYSSRSPFDKTMTFASFPIQQRERRPGLYAAAEGFANTFTPGDDMKGIYVFGPAGVGKTHLLHAIINRLGERGVPCIFIQADALFDRLRSLIGEGKDIEPVLEAFSSVPVLAIDEIGQERANGFTLEKMFRIINHRFSGKLPILFASNFAPPDLYKRLPDDLLPVTDPLRSRIIGMSQVAYLDGDDHRIATMDFLDT